MKTITLSANTSWYLFNFRASTIKALKNRGFRVVCLSPDDGYGEKLRDDLACEWRALAMDNSGNNPIKDSLLVFRFWRHYRQLKPQAAFHFTIKNNVYGTWAARSLGIPSINNVSGMGTAFISTGVVAMLVRLLYKMSMPLATQVFCQNEEDYELLIDQKLVPAARLKMLPGSGVNLQRFHPELRITNKGVFRFLYAGRMLAQKGLSELIQAIQTVNLRKVRCELWLVGFADVENVSAYSLDQLEEWGRIPGIKWKGPTDNMVEVYAQADCVVLPSYREGMPRSLLEAGAMGLPSVATDVPGCRNIIEHGNNGLLCEVKSVPSLASSLQEMLDMTEEDLKAMGNRARLHVQDKFDEQLVVDAAMDAISATGG
jgi:glycosyltransferase involved in cell wall biosynthesis